jgi:hypothetical protein
MGIIKKSLTNMIIKKEVMIINSKIILEKISNTSMKGKKKKMRI